MALGESSTEAQSPKWELSRLFRESDITVGPKNSAGENESGVDFVANGDGMERKITSNPQMGGFNMRPLNYTGRLGYRLTDPEANTGSFYLHADGELGLVEAEGDAIVSSDEATRTLDEKEIAAGTIKTFLEKGLKTREYQG